MWSSGPAPLRGGREKPAPEGRRVRYQGRKPRETRDPRATTAHGDPAHGGRFGWTGLGCESGGEPPHSKKNYLENRVCGTRGESQERPETHAQQRRMGHPAHGGRFGWTGLGCESGGEPPHSKKNTSKIACAARGETQERPETHAQQRRMGHPARIKGYFAGRSMGRMKLLPIR